MTSQAKSNSIDTIRQINQVARKYYHHDHVEFDHTSYLKDCLKALVSFFSEALLGDPSSQYADGYEEGPYLFSALSYKNDSGHIDFVRLEDNSDYQFSSYETRDLFAPAISELLVAIREDASKIGRA